MPQKTRTLTPDSTGENTKLEPFVLQEALTVQHLASSFQERD